MIITMGTKGGDRLRVDAGAADHMQLINETREEIKKIRKSDKVLFYLAAGTAFMDGVFKAGTAHAASLSGAFEPVKHILLDIADPLCYVMFVWGCIECMVGRPASGLNRIKYAALGYLAINWIPVIMDVIRNAGPGGA
jgi:hypothetical protein